MAGLITSIQLQQMLTECKQNPQLKSEIKGRFKGRDYTAICDVISDGYIERFDRYDSDVAEQFIRAYEAVKGV